MKLELLLVLNFDEFCMDSYILKITKSLMSYFLFFLREISPEKSILNTVYLCIPVQVVQGKYNYPIPIFPAIFPCQVSWYYEFIASFLLGHITCWITKLRVSCMVIPIMEGGPLMHHILFRKMTFNQR